MITPGLSGRTLLGFGRTKPQPPADPQDVPEALKKPPPPVPTPIQPPDEQP